MTLVLSTREGNISLEPIVVPVPVLETSRWSRGLWSLLTCTAAIKFLLAWKAPFYTSPRPRRPLGSSEVFLSIHGWVVMRTGTRNLVWYQYSAKYLQDNEADSIHRMQLWKEKIIQVQYQPEKRHCLCMSIGPGNSPFCLTWISYSPRWYAWSAQGLKKSQGT